MNKTAIIYMNKSNEINDKITIYENSKINCIDCNSYNSVIKAAKCTNSSYIDLYDDYQYNYLINVSNILYIRTYKH